MTQCPNCGIEIEMKPVRQPSGPDVIIPFVAGTDNLHDTISCLENQLSALRARHDGGDRGGTDMTGPIKAPVTIVPDPRSSGWYLLIANDGVLVLDHLRKEYADQIAAALNVEGVYSTRAAAEAARENTHAR